MGALNLNTHTLTHTHSLSLSLSHSLSLTHTHIHTLSLTHTHTLSLSHTHTHSLSHTHTHSLSLSLTHTHTLSLTHTHTHSLTHTHTHSLSHTHTSPGSFLVRPSEKTLGDYALAFRTSSEVRHWKIVQDAGKFYVHPRPNPYNSLEEIITVRKIISSSKKKSEEALKMYCMTWTSAPSLYNAYRRYDSQWCMYIIIILYNLPHSTSKRPWVWKLDSR